MNQCADRNLLFGILALQMDFISRDQLVAAMNAWMVEKEQPLGYFLVKQQALAEPKHELLDRLVDAHLDKDSQLDATTVNPDLDMAQVTTDLGLSGQIIEKPAPAAAVDRRFEALRLHARGGLGEVFVARDVDLHRAAPLNQSQQKSTNDATCRARFLLEAEVTGGLEHPGIVPVYALGAYSDGRPYYAMRFIRGDSLKEAIAAFHKAQTDGQLAGETTLALRRLLSRFLDVCNAIEYAHSRGVLHRDIKPGNVMVGQYGETLVVDWGLAKVLGRPDNTALPAEPLRPAFSGDSSHTQAGAAIGTPAYMSPEQAAGRLDLLGPAADIYSLGATLYTLLTGRMPFTGKNTVEVLAKVQRGEFPSPRHANPNIAPGLAAICLKAMALSPTDRYASAALLARDIERWLADEPVSVGGEPWSIRAGRWARRHKSLVAGTAVLLVTAVISLAISTILISHEQTRTQEQRTQAEANFQTAVRAVNEMLTEVAQEQLAFEPGMEKKRRALLASARNYYTQFLEKKSGDRTLRTQTAQAHQRLGDISRLLGEHEPAQQSYQQAIAFFTDLAKDEPASADVQDNLASCYNFLGETLRTISKTAEAEDAYRHAQRIQESLAGKERDKPAFRKSLARTHYNLGILLKDTQRPAFAEKEFDEAIAILKKLQADLPDVAEYQQHLARAYLNLGPVLRAADRPQKAEEVYREAIRLQSALVARAKHMPDYQHELAVTHNNLGFLLNSQKRSADAADEFREAIRIFDRLSQLFPGVPVYRKELANTQNNLGLVFARNENWLEADAAWRGALSAFEQLAASAPDVPDYEGSAGMVQGNLGWLAWKRKDLASAERDLEKAMERVRNALKPNPRNPTHLQVLRDQHEYLAETLIDKGEPARAATLAIALAEFFPKRGKDAFTAAGLLARCATAAKSDPAQAKAYADQSIAMLRQAIANGWWNKADLQGERFHLLGDREEFKRILETGRTSR